MGDEFFTNAEHVVETGHKLVDEINDLIRVVHDRAGNTYNKPKHAEMNMWRAVAEFKESFFEYTKDPEGMSGWRKR